MCNRLNVLVLAAVLPLERKDLTDLITISFGRYAKHTKQLPDSIAILRSLKAFEMLVFALPTASLSLLFE